MAEPKQTDQQLVELVQKGDKRAFDLLVLKYQHKIFGLISRYVKDNDEIQDFEVTVRFIRGFTE
jgi:RNA polymerase sigma-70 factor (ECF subfamily)